MSWKPGPIVRLSCKTGQPPATITNKLVQDQQQQQCPGNQDQQEQMETNNHVLETRTNSEIIR